MSSNLVPDAAAEGAAADPFLAQLHALRASLSNTHELRYRLEENGAPPTGNTERGAFRFTAG